MRGPNERAQDCWARNRGGTEREEVAPSGGLLAVGCREEGMKLSSEEMEWGSGKGAGRGSV